MSSQDRERRVILGKALSYSHVRQQHKFFNHEMGIDMQILTDIGRVLRLIIEFKFELWRCQCQCATLDPFIS
jgi:hypothetical protein